MVQNYVLIIKIAQTKTNVLSPIIMLKDFTIQLSIKTDFAINYGLKINVIMVNIVLSHIRDRS